MDVTSSLDFKTFGQHPVDGGGSCDIYRGRLHGGPVVALKVGRHHSSNQVEDANTQE
ncbi:hypothetical protein FRC11_011206, partial [Ceratobasidium sp. 423]